MNNICVIGVWVGAFKNYFNLWLKSAGFNYRIDFLVFTDKEWGGKCLKM